jgi:hypothetical protein
MGIYLFEGESRELKELQETSYARENILERKHLQQAFRKNVAAIAPGCLVIAEEFSEWVESARRIDLLAIDKNANIVVIELKRGENGENMELQAIRYAAMVSSLTFRKTVEIYQDYLAANRLEGDAMQRILEFLEWEEPKEEEFGLHTRMILVSHNFSRELTTSVMWLNESGLDISCVRITPYRNGTQLLVDIQQVIPLPEAENYQVRIREKTEERREAIRSARDYTQYVFLGRTFNKRKLALSIMKEWVARNEPATLEEARRAFPLAERSGGVFLPVAEARGIYERQGIPRHFLEQGETFRFGEEEYALSNQWGRGNLPELIRHAATQGLEITEAG